MSTRPTAPKNCTINRNGNHNCSCTQYIYPTAGCEQLITAYVNGYPEPNIIWLFNETVATNDTQNLFTVKEDNKSVSRHRFIFGPSYIDQQEIIMQM